MRPRTLVARLRVALDQRIRRSSASPNVGYFAGTGLLVVAAPFSAFPFHRRLAKVLAVLVLFLFACILLWLAFRPGQPLERPVLAQAGAIALVVLLTARVGLGWYRGRAGLAT